MKALADDASYYTTDGQKSFLSKGPVAVLPVRGTLVHRASYIDAESGMVGYNRFLAQLRDARADKDIRGIIVPVTSGGGECNGMLAAAEEVAAESAAEGGKPIYAYLDDHACSAAYVLISGCDKIIGRRECYGGSIAALLNMVDKSKAYEKMGLKQYVIRAEWADRKARGAGGEEFDDELIASLERLVDDMSSHIVEFVAAMRGMTEQSIKDLRGDIFTGTEMLRLGLLDDIASEKEAFAMLNQEITSI
jgi:ClpP class serine protease